MNAEHQSRGLGLLEALHVNDWPDGAEVTGEPNVVFLEDDDAYDKINRRTSFFEKMRNNDDGYDNEQDGSIGPGGTVIPPSSLYSSVCVGGTFDGMHYGAERIPPLDEHVSGVLDFVGNLAPGMKN